MQMHFHQWSKALDWTIWLQYSIFCLNADSIYFCEKPGLIQNTDRWVTEEVNKMG